MDSGSLTKLLLLKLISLGETSPQNIVSLLELFSKTSSELDFDQLLRLRASLLTLLSKSYPNEEDWESIHAIIISIAKIS